MIDTNGAASGMRSRAWRWHFLAALWVIPFVLWQSATGTLYLWSQQWADAQHPELRFVESSTRIATLDEQIAAARTAMPGSRITGVTVSADPKRSTLVTFNDARDLTVAVFVDPHGGQLLGKLDAWQWPYGWSRKLHGGWPLGQVGSWMLEIGACWTIVMVLTGLYLWWPRDGRRLRQILLPRFGAGTRVLWRDLHACVAVWISALLVAFLFTAMPWTSFWGEAVLRPVQQALGQQTPAAAGFAPVFAAASASPRKASLDDMLDAARADNMQGDVMLYMVDGPPNSALSLRSMRGRAALERYALFDRNTGAAMASADWNDFPVMAKAIATGVDLHEGSYFGGFGPWINTAFVAVLVWLSVTGFMAWWRRKPAHAIGVPARPRHARWPLWLKITAVLLCLLLPLLAISALLLWCVETFGLWLLNKREVAE